MRYVTVDGWMDNYFTVNQDCIIKYVKIFSTMGGAYRAYGEQNEHLSDKLNAVNRTNNFVFYQRTSPRYETMHKSDLYLAEFISQTYLIERVLDLKSSFRDVGYVFIIM